MRQDEIQCEYLIVMAKRPRVLFWGGAEEPSRSLVMYTLQQDRILLRHRHLAMGFAIDPGRWACKPVQATGGRLCSELNVWVS